MDNPFESINTRLDRLEEMLRATLRNPLPSAQLN